MSSEGIDALVSSLSSHAFPGMPTGAARWRKTGYEEI
jgi:hypothetical protein